MNLRAFQVDAFASGVFSGNPAVVVLLEESLGDDILMKIARESFVPETAFLLEDGDGYILRWFTPDIEMDLCGHATLASAHVLFTELGYPQEKINFKTKSGDLTVIRDGEMYEMDFPRREGDRATLPIEIYDSLSIKPVEVYKARDYLLIYNKRAEIENVEIDRPVFDEININPGGVILSAPGEDCDFVSRYFTPQATILEDPVTGSAHCTLAPYWGKRLGKEILHAKQISSRGGVIYCTVTPERVKLKGKAVTYSESRLNI